MWSLRGWWKFISLIEMLRVSSLSLTLIVLMLVRLRRRKGIERQNGVESNTNDGLGDGMITPILDKLARRGWIILRFVLMLLLHDVGILRVRGSKGRLYLTLPLGLGLRSSPILILRGIV